MPTTHSALRLFLAFELPAQVKSHLAETINALRATSGRSVKWVEPENMHLTAKFFGDTAQERIPDITSAVDETLSDKAELALPFALYSSKTGAFPSVARPRVFWSNVAGDDLSRLSEFVAALDDAFTKRRFEPESRAFKPHLTLGRPRRGVDCSAISLAFAKCPFERIDFTLETMTLYQSILDRRGPAYHVIQQWDLVKRFG